ncbi:MAG: carbohydrate ABC transporter permease [Lachnospiraceae bacterium]|nr:carbohydrate ABC transporter permease [Lachnospiraceae bacterium]
MKKKRRIERNVGTYIVLIILSVISLFPFYMMFVMGTYHSPDLFRGLPLLVSDYFTENMKTVLNGGIIRVYLNSIVVSVSSVLLCLLTSLNIGYALAKHDFKGKKLITMIVLMGMVLPTQVSIIGYVMEMRVWHLTNTLISIICVWIANPFSAFFMMQFIRDSVPTEILESARIDGCGESRMLYQVVVPCVKPAVLTISTLVFLWSWNNYMLPLIVLNRSEKYTLPLMISNIGVSYIHDYGAQMLALSVSTFPILIIFSIGSKYFVQGITAGAVKG